MTTTKNPPSIDELLVAASTPEPVIRALVSGHLRIAALIHGLRSAVEALGKELEKEEDETVRLAIANMASRSLLPGLSAVLADDQAHATESEAALIAGLLELAAGGSVDE